MFVTSCSTSAAFTKGDKSCGSRTGKGENPPPAFAPAAEPLLDHPLVQTASTGLCCIAKVDPEHVHDDLAGQDGEQAEDGQARGRAGIQPRQGRCWQTVQVRVDGRGRGRLAGCFARGCWSRQGDPGRGGHIGHLLRLYVYSERCGGTRIIVSVCSSLA